MASQASPNYDRFAGKTVLITGVCGTVGQEVLRQLSTANCRSIVGIDINENELFFLSSTYGSDDRVRLYLGSLRNRDSLNERVRGVDVVLHAAALKHVPMCESSPRDAVLTNIEGTNNLIDAATEAGVERMLFTSTDKAVNPTNVMGTSKLMAERLITASSGAGSDGRPIMASTRFGNVLGSRGSVIPVFRQQIKAGGPVRLTSQDMTRFIMTLEEAVGLVLNSVFMAHGGEVFVTKMPVIRIEDLALVMIDRLAPLYGRDPSTVSVEITGVRPGEKMYEELLNEEETRRTLETDDYYIVQPALKPLPRDVEDLYRDTACRWADKTFNSANVEPMSRVELGEYLIARGLLDADAS